MEVNGQTIVVIVIESRQPDKIEHPDILQKQKTYKNRPYWLEGFGNLILSEHAKLLGAFRTNMCVATWGSMALVWPWA